MASTLVAMASIILDLVAMTSNLVVMASNLEAVQYSQTPKAYIQRKDWNVWC